MIGDIGLFSIEGLKMDLSIERNDLKSDEGLRTAIVLSLFTDARVTTEELPPGETWKRGYWADELSDALNDRHGSKLWLLRREKQTQEVAERAKQYAEESLQWLTEDGIAKSVSVMTEWVTRGTLGIAIEIEKPAGDLAQYKFSFLWASGLGA